MAKILRSDPTVPKLVISVPFGVTTERAIVHNFAPTDTFSTTTMTNSTLYMAGLLLFALSCKPADTVPSAEVLICTDWIQLGSRPDGETIIFYPESGGDPYTFRTNSVERSTVQVPPGYCTVMVFNRTPEEFGTLDFTGMSSPETAQCTLKSRLFPWVGRSAEAGRTVYEPEEIVVGRVNHSNSDSVFITPQRRVMEGTVSIRVNGVHNIKAARAYLTGMAGGAFLSSGMASDSPVTHVPEHWSITHDPSDHTKGCLSASFRCFGMADGRKDTALHLELLLVDNSTRMEFTFDAGDRCSENARELTFNLDIGQGASPADTAIVIPDVRPEHGGENGFNADIDEWDDSDILIIKI